MVVSVTDLVGLIGVRIRQIRKLRNLTQEQLGERAQLQSTYIGGVERGERNISIETLEKLIRALEMSPSEFFYFGDNPIEKNTDKNELIHIFISKLMTQENKNIRKMINIYKEIFE
ncbi:anaerobic benzoate catabolism transcriptional regulator [compost metagenome]